MTNYKVIGNITEQITTFKKAVSIIFNTGPPKTGMEGTT